MLSICYKYLNGLRAALWSVVFVVVGLFAIPSFAQTKTFKVSGTVKDAKGLPLIGVSVKVKDSQSGASTDGNGQYQISVSNSLSAVLIFSYIGFEVKHVQVNNKNVVDVMLSEQASNLNDVVVIGYGTVKRKDLTGSVGQVSMSDLNKAPVRSFDEALAGRVAGVSVQSSDGQPGSNINIVIRGNNSVTQDNSPLYVVDGFPIENANNNVVNPNDIESIEILKDASATAIYGARGANGVVMITTKKGKEGTPVINFNASYGFQNNIKQMEMMTPYDFVKYQIEFNPALTDPTTKTPTQIYLTDPGKTLDDYRNVQGTNWQDKVMRTAGMGNYSLSLTGGTKQTKYAVSGSIFDQDGILLNSGYKRYQGRVVLDHSINDKFKVGINTNYSYLMQSGISPSQLSFTSSNYIMTAVWGARPVSPNVESGIEDLVEDPSNNPTFDRRANPIIGLQNLVRNNRTKNLTFNAYAEYAILPSLKLRVAGGIVDNEQRNESFNNSKTQFGLPGNVNGVNGSMQWVESSTWLNENTLTWSKNIKKHTFNVLSGFTAQGSKSSNFKMAGNQLLNEDVGVSGLDESLIPPPALGAGSSLWNMASFLGRINYSYDSKYLLTASFRADGSSKFSETNHWGYFPSAAVSWRFSNEEFLKNSILSDGKLKLSIGNTGNNRVSDFAYLSSVAYSLNPSAYVFNNAYVPGIVPISLANPSLKWETTQQINLGIDLGFLKDRIQLTAEVYQKKTRDLLLDASLPTSSGFAKAFKNVGMVKNEGFELSLNTLNIKNENFSWSSNFNISFNQNKVLALNEGEESIPGFMSWDSGWSGVQAYITKLGQPLGMIYGLVSDGTYKYEDFNRTATGGYILKDNITANGAVRNIIQPGDVKYRDINGDLVVDVNDYTVIGRGLPIHYGGFTNNFTYKGFDLNVFLQWSYGNDILNANRIMFEGNRFGRVSMNQYASYVDRWSPENPDSNIPRTKGYSNLNAYISDYVEDGSYLRLKTVALGYTFSNRLLNSVKIRSLRAYASAQNLFTLANYSGMDPEVNNSSSPLTPGFDYSTYPRARTISFGVNVSF